MKQNVIYREPHSPHILINNYQFNLKFPYQSGKISVEEIVSKDVHYLQKNWSEKDASKRLQKKIYENDLRFIYGDALIVGHKVGVFPELTKAAEKIIKVNEIVEPVEEWVEAYDKLYPYYVEMYKHLDTDLKALKNTVDQL